MAELDSLFWAAYRQRQLFVAAFVSGAEDIAGTVAALLDALDGRTAAA